MSVDEWQVSMSEPMPAPIIDMQPLYSADAGVRRPALVEMERALCDTGFFCAVNHRVPAALTARVYEHAGRFHGLADDDPIKRQVHKQNSPSRRGFSAAGEEPAYQPGTISHCASFDISREPAGDERAGHAAAHGNLWPDERALPGFRGDVVRYYREAEALGRVLFEGFAEMLGLDRDCFARHSTERAASELRLLHYPAREQPADERHVGISAHTDFECFTILSQDAPGLQLMNRDGAWVEPPAWPMSEARLIVIVGDMLERWTNGTLQATRHRVRTTPWERLSLILFCAIDPDVVVAPLDAFTSAENPPRYPPITQRAHIDAQMAAALANMQGTGR